MNCSGLFGIALLVLCSVTVAVNAYDFSGKKARYYERMCDDIEDVVCSQCKHGSWVNPCGKLACLIGVGGTCDDQGKPFRHGRCANGLFCLCDKCQGCIGDDCYNDSSCMHHK